MTAGQAIRLDTAALAEIGARGVPVPGYDRAAVGVGIVHFGVGGFHRAHQAMYLDRLLNAGQATDFGICGVGVMPVDRAMAADLRAQDYLYTLVVKHPDGRHEPAVIGSIVKYLYAPDDPAAVLEQLADPGVRIVSLTITEGGYHYNQATGEFDPTDPQILADVHTQLPTTVFGLVVAGLALRRERGIAPFTVMSCDNIQENGDLARRVFAAFASLRDPAFGSWIESEVAFPNSMVDRITPVTTDADRADLRTRFGVDDARPVVTEPFCQWVLQDSFGLGRPDLAQAGVMLVQDVRPYELMKLRLLNVGHQVLAYVAALCGYRYAHEAVADPLLRELLTRYLQEEGAPTVPSVPGIDLAAYCDQLIERISNAEIADTVARLASEASDRIPKWLVPVVRENLAAGRPVTIAATVIAAWARYAEDAELVDRRAEQVRSAAGGYGQDRLSFLRQSDLFGDLVDQPAFTGPYRHALELLHTVGVQPALVEVLGPRHGDRPPSPTSRP